MIEDKIKIKNFNPNYNYIETEVNIPDEMLPEEKHKFSSSISSYQINIKDLLSSPIEPSQVIKILESQISNTKQNVCPTIYKFF